MAFMFPERGVPYRLSSEQSAGDVWIAQLDRKDQNEFKGCRCLLLNAKQISSVCGLKILHKMH